MRSPAAIRGWLCRIVVNTAMDVLRARSRQADAEHIPETGQEDVYQDTDLMQALDLLDERERTVIVLRFFQELKLQDRPGHRRERKHCQDHFVPQPEETEA